MFLPSFLQYLLGHGLVCYSPFKKERPPANSGGNIRRCKHWLITSLLLDTRKAAFSPSLHLPEPHVPITVSIEELLAVGGPGDGLYWRAGCKGLQVVRTDIGSGICLVLKRHVPCQDGAVVAGGGKLQSARSPGNGVDLLRMGLKFAHLEEAATAHV